eukprot:6201778-Pleurochrysis_carterae.AAC.4
MGAHRCRVLCVTHASSLASMGVACMAATGAGVLQLSIPGVSASVGFADLVESSAQSAVAALLVSRVPPRGGRDTGPRHGRGGSHRRYAPAVEKYGGPIVS